ncbi:MAG: hypothetical protein J1F11_03230 [Oscillospiraceae bacterium]|nr:hypothetical protein [Oscillospiraceae bacterium]
MINMIKADFYRVLKGKGIYFSFAIIIILIAVSIYFVEPGTFGVRVETGTVFENVLSDMSYDEINELSMNEYRRIMLDTEGYALDKEILAYNINLYYPFIFIAAIFITADFSGSCIKNTLSSSISRRKYFFSKLAAVFICCLILFFLNTYIVYFANIIFNSKNLASDIGTVTKITLLQIPPILAIVSMLTGIAFMLKRTASYNGVTIPFMMVIQLLLMLLSALFKIPQEMFNYELQGMIVKLAIDPSPEFVLKSYAVCAAIIVLFNFVGWMCFKKAEIK